MIRKLLARAVDLGRFEDHRSLFWSPYYPSNFGELIGPFLYEKLTGVEPWHRSPDDFSRSSVYMSVGSILSMCAANAIVWGSGILSRDAKFTRPWRVSAVRGPLSYEAFRRQGYDCPQVFGDPAILLPLVLPRTGGAPTYDVGVIPHFFDHAVVSAQTVAAPGTLFIDVRYPIEQVVEQICSCRQIVSSSLHGIIVAHAYGVPARWVRWAHDSGDGVKYLDYFESVGDATRTPLQLGAPSVPPASEFMRAAESATLPDHSSARTAILASCPYRLSTKLKPQAS